MILTMSCLFLVISILGGFTIMRRGSKTDGAVQMPAGFSMLFAGIGYCSLALGLYPLAFYLGTVWGFALLFFAPFAGALGGSIFGYRAGLKRKALIRSVAEI
jgi:hypothetical protein